MRISVGAHPGLFVALLTGICRELSRVASSMHIHDVLYLQTPSDDQKPSTKRFRSTSVQPRGHNILAL